MASILEESTKNSNNKKYPSSSEDSNHFLDDDEKFYDAFDDTVELLNSLNIDVNLKTNNEDLKTATATTTTTSISSNENNEIESNENDNNSKLISITDNRIEDAELETPWTLWFDRCIHGANPNDYEAGLKYVYTIKTVQIFWKVLNNIPDVSQLPNRCSYHLMRGSRKPLWEDPGNEHGGQWNLKCGKSDTPLVWREALLAAIGEEFSDSLAEGDEVVGISASCRERDDIIHIWNYDSNLESKSSVCQKLEELVPNIKFNVKFYKPNNLHGAFKESNPKKNFQK